MRALGTTARVVVADPSALEEARRVLVGELNAVDRACSRFRDDSELSRLNRSGGREIPIGPVLIEALEVALRAAALTGGDVDPTIGEALVAAGYDRDFELLSDGDGPGRVRVRPAPGWRAVEIDRRRCTARVPEGLLVDLGATAKALAADRCAAAVHRSTGTGTLVSLGGDVAVAGPPPEGGWTVRVGDDHRREGPGDEGVAIGAGGLATSGTTARRWGRGRMLHHIMDPRTGRPAAGPWRTVSVTAATCVDANTASTAAIVRGEGAREWLAARRLPARLVSEDGGVVRVAGWPEPPR